MRPLDGLLLRTGASQARPTANSEDCEHLFGAHLRRRSVTASISKANFRCFILNVVK
jgi:hypothetical protein